MAEATRDGRWGKVHLAAVKKIAPNMTAVAVYAYLCCCANTSGESWPANETISDDLSVSAVTVRRALKVLLDRDLIEGSTKGRYVIPELRR